MSERFKEPVLKTGDPKGPWVRIPLSPPIIKRPTGITEKRGQMINACIFGFGNIGKSVYDALLASSDFTVSGVVSRSLEPSALGGTPVMRDMSEIADIDVAILCSPSRAVPCLAADLLARGISTVDSFDIHSDILDLKKYLDPIAKEHSAASIISAGWDPGTDSVVRALMEAMSPRGITYTNFGPGMSMGHSVVAKSKPGVRDALSMTIPLGTSVHRRMVYVELDGSVSLEDVTAGIKNDDYFVHDETHVISVPSVAALRDTGHGVSIERKGVSGKTDNQRFGFTMSANNPALTAQILVSAARAVTKQPPGCYTLIEIPPVNMISGDIDETIKRLV
jgi:diaminopimelate dehydrogenase